MDDDLMSGEYRCFPLSEIPVPIPTDFMIAWTAANGSMSERWNLLCAIEKRRGKTIRLFYERQLLHWRYKEREGLELD